MKATNLMVGDWVIFKAETPKICKVVSIDTTNGNYIRQSLTDTYYTEDCFEPIPLTTEILVKNGYKRESIGNYSCTFPEDTHYKLEITTDGTGIWWTIHDDEYSILKLDYVHELQHAIKLCGIDKEIIL